MSNSKGSRKNSTIYIKCPNPACNAEYLPAEIYLPNYFFGKPYDIEKEHITGKIKNYLGTPMDLNETYICDYCHTPFKVSAKVQFSAYQNDKYDFNTDYSTKLKKTTLFLEED